MKFYCGKCGARVPLPQRGCECGEADDVWRWQCRCGTINDRSAKRCSHCGTSKTAMYRAQTRRQEISEQTLRDIAGFVTGLAVNRGMPTDFIDDAVGDAILRALDKIDQFDPDRGDLLSWMKGIAYRSLMDQGRRSQGHEMSLDFEGEDGEIFAESIADETPRHIDAMASEDERSEFVRAARETMLVAIGSFASLRDRKEDVYHHMVVAYMSTDGSRGWKSKAARLSGVHRSTIWKVVKTAKMLWRGQ